MNMVIGYTNCTDLFVSVVYF